MDLSMKNGWIRATSAPEKYYLNHYKETDTRNIEAFQTFCLPKLPNLPYQSLKIQNSIRAYFSKILQVERKFDLVLFFKRYNFEFQIYSNELKMNLF